MPRLHTQLTSGWRNELPGRVRSPQEAFHDSVDRHCLRLGTLQEKLEAIAAAEFTAVESFENDLIAFPGSPAEIRRICGDLGLTIVTCQPFRDLDRAARGGPPML